MKHKMTVKPSKVGQFHWKYYRKTCFWLAN